MKHFLLSEVVISKPWIGNVSANSVKPFQLLYERQRNMMKYGVRSSILFYKFMTWQTKIIVYHSATICHLQNKKPIIIFFQILIRVRIALWNSMHLELLDSYFLRYIPLYTIFPNIWLGEGLSECYYFWKKKNSENMRFSVWKFPHFP